MREHYSDDAAYYKANIAYCGALGLDSFDASPSWEWTRVVHYEFLLWNSDCPKTSNMQFQKQEERLELRATRSHQN